jgi:predicted nicotinamide N-methyase
VALYFYFFNGGNSGKGGPQYFWSVFYSLNYSPKNPVNNSQYEQSRKYYLYRMNFKTNDITLPIGSFDIKLTTIDNIDELYDALIQKGSDHEDVKDERIPYWAELWASAIGMSRYLVDNPLVTSETSVLEIGCGLGLPSIVAGLQGAKQVVMSDYLQEALDFAQHNWSQNVSLKKPILNLMDWRTPDPAVSADLLLASDVAYEKRAFEPLLKAFKTLVKPNGRILISEPNRPVSKDFFSNLQNMGGYAVKHTQMKVERKGHEFTVNIYELNQNE